MFKELRFALYAIKKNLQNSAELRASFLINIFGMALNNLSFIIIWVFFVQAVGNIHGWTAMDIVAMQGIVSIVFGAVFSLGAGIGNMATVVTSGAFDRFMLSPKNLLLRAATSALGVSALGDALFGLICLVVYGVLIQISWLQILLLFVLVIVAIITFFAVTVSIYSMSFLCTDANSVTNGLFQLFLTPSLFHGGAFQGVMRFVFTFIIPSLLIGALPAEIMRDINLRQLALVSLLAFSWLWLSIKIFGACVRRYESANFVE